MPNPFINNNTFTTNHITKVRGPINWQIPADALPHTITIPLVNHTGQESFAIVDENYDAIADASVTNVVWSQGGVTLDATLPTAYAGVAKLAVYSIGFIGQDRLNGSLETASTIDFTVGTPVQVVTGDASLDYIKKNNFAATSAPTVNDDSSISYSVGSIWIDVTADEVYQCVDATATAAVWKNLSVTGSNVVKNPATPYTAGNNDVIVWDATAENKVVNLPAAASSTNYRVDIKKIDGTANTITVDGDGAETIDGGPTAVLTTQYEAISLICDGTEWHIIAGF